MLPSGDESDVNPHKADVFLYEPWRSKGFFQFEITTNVLVRSFRFILIHLL